jgi:hypothetical protein
MIETYGADVRINGCDALVGTGFQQLRGDDLFNGKDDTILTPDANGGTAILDSLDSVLDLKVATVGGEDGVEQVVTCADGRLDVPWSAHFLDIAR